MDKMYFPTPDGYCGDEDNGQTSAWYVFSAMGFYPVCPGSDQYILGTPCFRDMTLHLENGNKVHLSAPANSRANRYVDSVMLNGAPHKRNYFTHKELTDGAHVTYAMSAEPNTERGTDPSAYPYSFSSELNELGLK